MTEFDFDARYTHPDFRGVALYSVGYAVTLTDESWEYCGEGDPDDEANYFYNDPEEIENKSRVRCIMVGDDQVFELDVDDLEAISGDDYCPECGQIGCKAYG